MYTCLADTSNTLRHLILDDLKSDVGPHGLAGFFLAGANRGVSLATPHEMSQAGAAIRQGVSVWLYRAVRDDQRLNDPPTLRPLSSRQVEVVPPPLPLRLHYLMTPLADGKPETEQKLLGRVLQLFHTNPIISGAALRGDLTGTSAQIHVRLEALTLDEIARVWEALEGSYQLSVSYEVSLANIESRAVPQRSSVVESFRPELGVIMNQGA